MFASQPMPLREALNIVRAGCAQAPANKDTHILMERALKTIEAALFPPPEKADEEAKKDD